MGPNQTKNGKSSNNQLIGRNNFEFMYVIGRGGFGKVWKVTFKKTNKSYALKEMSKVKVMDRKSEKSIKNEREILAQLKNDFIVNMIYSFQDYENLYLVMDLLTGGDLRYHISKRKKFTENETKFFICCILEGLEYIHKNKVIHRDIKPENLVLDASGYLRITDFGVAKYFTRENSSETSGTPGYMAPEVMCSQNHSYAVDFFAVGVIAYEFMNGYRPYYAKSRREIKELILSKQVQIKKSEIPDEWSIESADFINKRKPMNRLGYMGIKEVKEHPWIKNFSWEDLRMRKIDAPYLPKYSDNFDKKYCEAPDQIGNETQERYHNYYRRDNYLDLFNEYTFYNQEEKEKFNMIINRKHTNSQSLLNQPAHMKKIRHNKYSASIDITSNMKTINTDKFTNNFNNTNKNSFKDTINHNDDVSINRSNNRLKGIHSSNYRSSIISNSKKKSDKLPLILSPSINNSKSKEKFLPFNSINKLKLNKNNILSIKNHKFGTISSSSTGSSLVSLNTLRKKSK